MNYFLHSVAAPGFVIRTVFFCFTLPYLDLNLDLSELRLAILIRHANEIPWSSG